MYIALRIFTYIRLISNLNHLRGEYSYNPYFTDDDNKGFNVKMAIVQYLLKNHEQLDDNQLNAFLGFLSVFGNHLKN